MALGVILAPYGETPTAYPSTILLSVGGDGTYMQPNYDKQFNTRGEPGYYYDTPLGAVKPSLLDRIRARFARRALGAIPTDAELSHRYQHTPVHAGWVSTQDGYAIPSGWLPPNGWRQGGYPLPAEPLASACSGFGLAPATPDSVPPPSPGIIRPMLPPRTTPASIPDALLPPAPAPAPVADPNAPASVADVLAAIQAHNDRMFALQVVASAAVSISALITIFRTIKLIRTEHGRG